MQILLMIDYVSIDRRHTYVCRRSNRSKLKTQLLIALVELENGAGEPDAFGDDLKKPYFGVTTIARQIYGTTVFTDDNKLDKSRRVCLNKSLNALYIDGFIDKQGRQYRGVDNKDPRVHSRDVVQGFWSITDLGVGFAKVLSGGENRLLDGWMQEHRFYGIGGIKINRSTVKRIDNPLFG